MDERESLARRFEGHRSRLRAVSYRMLGSLSEADDAVQEAWVRLDRAGAAEIENLGAWLTTVAGRVCLNMLESRRARREEPLVRVPDPVVSFAHGIDPEQEALLGESVGLALLVVLEELTPPERIAFVLHDVFAVPFDEVATVVGRSPAAARQLASRARRRVRGASARTDADPGRQREVVSAFLEAARGGDFDALLSVLDPDVLLRTDRGSASADAPSFVRGARDVASGAMLASGLVRSAQVALVNGAAGIVSWGSGGRPFSVMAFTVEGGKIVAIDVLADPERLGRLGLPAVDD